MTNLTNVTFNIPVKIDSPERLENLKLTIDYLLYHFDTNIIVYEVSMNAPVYIDRNPKIRYIFENIGNKPFHRTKYLNDMALLSRTPIIVNYDCDVILAYENYIKAATLITENKADGVFPYDGLFVNVPRIHMSKIQETKDVSFIDVEKTENFGRGSVGGALFWNKTSFIKGGMENEHFISWGCEDWERIKRFSGLGYTLGRIKGPLYHISHPRGTDSCEQNPYYIKNTALYKEVERLSMNQAAIRSYVNQLPWMQLFKT